MGVVVPDGRDVERLHPRQPIRCVRRDTGRAAAGVGESSSRSSDRQWRDTRRHSRRRSLRRPWLVWARRSAPHLGHRGRRLCRPALGEVAAHGLGARGSTLRRSECPAAAPAREDHEASSGVLRPGGTDARARRAVVVATVCRGVGRRMRVDALADAVLRDRPLFFAAARRRESCCRRSPRPPTRTGQSRRVSFRCRSMRSRRRRRSLRRASPSRRS